MHRIYTQILNDPKREMELEIHELKDRFTSMWLALDTKDKQAHPCPQVLPTGPDAEPSGTLVSRGL